MRPRRTGGATLGLSVLAGLKGAVLGALLVLGIALAVGAGADPVVQRTPAEDAYARLVDRAGLRCSSAGQDTAGSSAAVIRLPDGRLKAVSFERGWAVYTGERPGTLVAVCASASPSPSPS